MQDVQVRDCPISPQVCVEEGVERDGSSLSGVSAVCQWEDSHGRPGLGLTLLEVRSASMLLTNL